jgi:hypothetical protein
MGETTRLNLKSTREEVLRQRFAAKRRGMSGAEMEAQMLRNGSNVVLKDGETRAGLLARLDASIRAAKKTKDTSNP